MRNTHCLKASFRKCLTVAALSFFVFLSGTAVLLAEEAGGPGLNPLKTWKTDLALWTFIVFVLLLAVLWKFAFGPIVNALDARQQAVLDKIRGAEIANADAKELLNQYQQKLADSEHEVRQMIEDARAQGERIGEGLVAKARAEAEEEHKRALREIAAASDNAQADLAAKGAELATSLAGKILKERITPEDHVSLIQDVLKEFSKN
jgi:F-type H+-transporting ATPase subunit b